MPAITRLTACEILDSRGRPTLQATCRLHGGHAASAQVPSGASTGHAEAHELRDRDPARHAGLGCRRAAENVRGEIQGALAGRDFANQHALDAALVQLDGTPAKSRLGANAILAVSLAFARAHASARGVPLYRHFADLLGERPSKLPRPTVNLFSGGKHAGSQVAIQDVLIVPTGAPCLAEAFDQVAAVIRAATQRIVRKYGSRALVADEGGLAPDFPDSDTMLTDALAAIEGAGFVPGEEMALALDVASSHFHADGVYHLDGQSFDSGEMIERAGRWASRFPLVSLEDPLAEEDWAGWASLYRILAGRTRLLGDDFLCTNPLRIRRAVTEGCADALLLKVNQVGTLSEAVEARALARAAGWGVTVSARSGETEDDWLADLAVGWSGDYLKVGSLTRSERLSKYNRLLTIEGETQLAVA
jgi:enolase